MIEEVLVASVRALAGGTAAAPGGGTVPRLATAPTRPVEAGDLLVVVE